MTAKVFNWASYLATLGITFGSQIYYLLYRMFPDFISQQFVGPGTMNIKYRRNNFNQ